LRDGLQRILLWVSAITLITMKPWKVILTDIALADLDHIVETTLEKFGTIQ
jgi:hypothetical protein